LIGPLWLVRRVGSAVGLSKGASATHK
jgi:hypothetical protein